MVSHVEETASSNYGNTSARFKCLSNTLDLHEKINDFSSAKYYHFAKVASDRTRSSG